MTVDLDGGGTPLAVRKDRSAGEGASATVPPKPLGLLTTAHVISVFVILQIMSAADRGVLSIMVDDVKLSLGLNDFQIGLVQGVAFMLFYATFGVIVGGAADRYSRRWIMYIGVTFWSLAAAGVGLATTFVQLFFARMLVGLGEASLGPSVASLASDLFPPKRLSVIMATYVAASMVGTALSLTIGGWLLDNIGAATPYLPSFLQNLEDWRLTVLALALPGLLIAFLALTLREPPRRTSAGAANGLSWREFAAFLKLNRALVAQYLGGYALIAMASWPSIIWGAAYGRRVLELSPTYIGSMMGLIVGVVGVGATIAAGALVDFLVGRGMKDAAIRVSVCTAAIAMPTMIAGFTIHSPVFLALGLVSAMCFLQSLIGPALALTQLITPPQFRGRMTAVFVLVTSVIGVAIGPMVVGFLTDIVYGSPMRIGWSLVTLVCLCLPTAIWLLLSARRKVLAIMPDAE